MNIKKGIYFYYEYNKYMPFNDIGNLLFLMQNIKH